MEGLRSRRRQRLSSAIEAEAKSPCSYVNAASASASSARWTTSERRRLSARSDLDLLSPWARRGSSRALAGLPKITSTRAAERGR